MTSDQMTSSRAVRGSQSNFQASQRPTRVASMIAPVLSAALLSACGGGGADSAADTVAFTDSNTSLAKTTTGFTPKPTTPNVLTPVTNSPNDIVAGPTITDFEIQNTGLAQTNVPFTFGQVVAAGQMAKTDGLAARLSNGTLIRLQADVKATHADGSVRHVIVSGVLPSLAVGQIEKIQLVRSTASEKSTVSLQSLAASGLTGKIALTVDGVQYNATLADALASPKPLSWLSGNIVNEWILSVPLKNGAGAVHPLLTASFAVRWYPGLSKQARVDVVVENTKTFQAAPRNLTYDVNVEVGGRSVYSQAGLTHYRHSRWHQVAWWNATNSPQTHVRHNTAYLIASKAVSNYDQSVPVAESTLADLGKAITAANTGPMKIGPVMAAMGTTGGRADIGPLPLWSVAYLLSKDQRALKSMMAAADGSASWSIHMRDENTGFPVRTDTEANKGITTHMNLANRGPLPVPRCANNDNALCKTPYADDTAHQPSLVYLPYLLTGDYYYLEELQFWAASNPLRMDPNGSGQGKGLVRWQQVRGQAWSLRTLGHAAYITPDAHPLKDYFNNQVGHNIDYYHTTYVVGNPNKLGVYDGTGPETFKVTASAPWQDDFLTWSFGYLVELGYTKAQPMLQWKSKYPVGRMTDPGFCWIEGSAYHLLYLNANNKVVDTFAELYALNFTGSTISHDQTKMTHPQGLNFIDQACNSQAQADWITAARGKTWPLGRMSGFSDSPLGYPANMQPALAVAATSGIPNATQAWTIFNQRTDKQDYGKGPQWNIIPR